MAARPIASAAVAPTVATPSQRSGGDRRGVDRRPIGGISTLRDGAARPLDVIVRDLSPTGISLTCVAGLDIGDAVSVALPGFGSYAARVVRRNGDNYGCAFIEEPPVAAVLGSFVRDTVVTMTVSVLPVPSVADPDRWPLAARGWMILGLAVAGWGGVIALVLG